MKAEHKVAFQEIFSGVALSMVHNNLTASRKFLCCISVLLER